MAKASDFEGKKQDELFYFVEYSPEEAERIGYSNYSYWGSVIQNFLKQKVAVFCLILFLALTVFSFIALGIGKYHYTTLISDSSKAFIKPNSEYWFGPTTWAVTTGARCGTPPRFPSVWLWWSPWARASWA